MTQTESSRLPVKVHPNSRIVTVRRAGSFLERAQGPQIADYFADSKVSIGSYFKSRTSTKIASGLTNEEEELLMPQLVDIEPDDKEFRKAVTLYFTNINTPVPHNTGVKLETGLRSDNDKPVSKNNMPLDVDNYVRWRHALEHPFVASGKDESDSNALKQFYIFDPAALQDVKSKDTLQKDSAMQLYLTVKQDIKKVDMMLTLLGTDPRGFSGKDKDAKKIEALRGLTDTNPEAFITAYNDRDMEIRYAIQAMIDTGVLKKSGPRYITAEDNTLLGSDLEETIFWFKDDKNSDIVGALKGRMQDALLTPIQDIHKKTIV